MARMTTERFFGGVEGRVGYLASTLEYVARHQPTQEQLVDWIIKSTPAGSENVVQRNLSFLVAVDLLDIQGDKYKTTNKGQVFWEQERPLVMYEGLEKAVDGFRTIARSIPKGARTVEEIQETLRQEYPDYNLPEGVVTKHLDWLLSLGLVEVNDSTYSIPIEGGNFEDGQLYNRWFLHDVFKGGRFNGISKPKDQPLIFIFTGDSGKKYGYEDEFRDDGTFVYSGEGTVDEMTMDSGNNAVREHKKGGKSLHVFESTDMPWMVQYVGEFVYDHYEEEELQDQEGDYRSGFQFYLKPIDETTITLPEKHTKSLSDKAVFDRAKKKSSSRPIEPKQRSGASSYYPGSEEVRRYALRVADGVCQGCKEEAPFYDKNDEPYLEVHHIEPRSSGGPDTPKNVIAICANCHRRVHNGRNGEKLNKKLERTANEHYQRFQPDV